MYAQLNRFFPGTMSGLAVVAALAVTLPSVPAAAGFIVTPNDEMGGVGSLLHWSFTTDGLSITLYENWGDIDPVGMFIIGNAPSLFGSTLFGDGGTLFEIEKNLINMTDFAWTSFHIDLLPNDESGSIIVDPDSVNSSFSDFEVMNNDDGSANIWYLIDKKDGDTPVLPGEDFFMEFDMFLFDSPSGFRMIQTPVPAPGALALLGLGALAKRRRRRSA